MFGKTKCDCDPKGSTVIFAGAAVLMAMYKFLDLYSNYKDSKKEGTE